MDFADELQQVDLVHLLHAAGSGVSVVFLSRRNRLKRALSREREPRARPLWTADDATAASLPPQGAFPAQVDLRALLRLLRSEGLRSLRAIHCARCAAERVLAALPPLQPPPLQSNPTSATGSARRRLGVYRPPTHYKLPRASCAGGDAHGEPPPRGVFWMDYEDMLYDGGKSRAHCFHLSHPISLIIAFLSCYEQRARSRICYKHSAWRAASTREKLLPRRNGQ